MDDKEVRIDTGLGSSIHNDCSKRLQNGNITYANRDKSYSDSPQSLGKTDTRPCAIIGPDRVLPSAEPNDVYMKTIPVEPWEYPNGYCHPYDSIKMSEFHQAHNISPRLTFQENMQRIMVPPTYSSIKGSDETSVKNPKLNVPMEGNYSDVPYSVNMSNSEPKGVRSDSAMPPVNTSFPRATPHGWHGGGMQPLKSYPAQEYYNTEYSSCTAPRPMPIIQPQRIVHDEMHPMYADRLYQESNIRFKPYPTSKEKFPQPRYEYANTFQPPQNPIHKFDVQKLHGHHYSIYPHGPYKYPVDRRYPDPGMENHPRAPYPQHNAFRTHPIHPSYGPLPGNFYHNKPYPCPSDNPKTMHANKLSYDANNKIYLELENPRYKGYPSPDNFYYNDRSKLMRGDILVPGHPQLNTMGQQHLYRKDNLSIKSYDHTPHFPYREHRSLGNPRARVPMQFSPNTVPISPCDSNTSNDTLMLGIPQEDCGYASQSSTTSVRSLDSNTSPADYYKRPGFHFAPTIQNASQRESHSKSSGTTDNKKGLNLRQFLTMWNEGDEEDTTTNNTDQTNSSFVSPKAQATNNQEQLYVLGSVTVPKEELSKYEHLQKISKLPENIKGYNNIEILNQFEKLVESPNLNNSQVKNPPHKEYKVVPPKYPTNQIKDNIQRPVSPLDVEAKISQSVIHKEVGCNFEIKPCSPKVLNVDAAAPVHDVLGERFIEKVANPVLLSVGKDIESKIEIIDKTMKVTSCKLNSGTYNQNKNSVNSALVKPMFPLQDLNANMGVCLASLPQLDSDIDLNLPEVNQQFINANKIKTSRSPQPNVSLLDNIHSDNNLTKNKNMHNEALVTYLEPDKETTKLSKYRKSKKVDTFINDQVSQANSCSSSTQRTDSVIIKNPENVKVCNESHFVSMDIVNNLGCNEIAQEEPTKFAKKFLVSEHDEKAIDFSVNRNDKLLNMDNVFIESSESVNNESHLYQTNDNFTAAAAAVVTSESSTVTNQAIEFCEKNKKPKESDLRSTSKLNDDVISVIHCKDSKKAIKLKKTREKLLTSKELSSPEAKAYDCQSEIGSLPEQTSCDDHNNREVTKEEEKANANNHNRCDSENVLPDLSFDLAAISKEQCTPNTNNNSNQNSTELELETAVTNIISNTDVKENKLNYTKLISDITVVDSQVNNITESETITDHASSVSNKTKTETDTSKLVDTIEKELEDMDTISDIDSNAFSTEYKNYTEYVPSITAEANTTDLLLEDLNETPSSANVSVITSSDTSRNLEVDERAKSEISNFHQHTPVTDATEKKHDLQSLNNIEELPSNIKINKTQEVIPKQLPNENYLENKQKILNEPLHNTENKDKESSAIEENNCLSKDDANNDSASCIDDEINVSENNKTKPYHDSAEGDTCTVLNDNIISEGDKKLHAFNNTPYNRRGLKKTLFSPWIQNLVLYNIDDQMLSKNKHEIKDDNSDYTVEHLDINLNDSPSKCETVDEIQNCEDCNENYVKEMDITTTSDERCELSEIMENTKSLDENVSQTAERSPLASECQQTHSRVRCPSPLTLSPIRTKLLKRTTKRSLSDSALRSYLQDDESVTKKCKRNEEGFFQSSSDETTLSNLLRRNSISEIYNDGNFVILIDKDLILSEDNQEPKICFTNEQEITDNYNSDHEIIDTIAENLPQYEKELWLEDVACTETVLSNDVAEDIVIGTPSSPKDFMLSEYETVNNESFMLCEEVIKNMENDVDASEFNSCHDSSYSIHTSYEYYHESNVHDIFTCLESPKDSDIFTDDKMETNRRKAENILNHFETSTALFPKAVPANDIMQDDKENVEVHNLLEETESDTHQSNTLLNEEHSDDENYEDYSCTLTTCSYSSSPEVTSTTSEDKTPGIILKISNHKRLKASQIDDSKPVINSKISYKLTEKKKYKTNFNSTGTLITKAAQKYIPPIKITISDLKVKLPLPKNSLDKLKQLKKSKVEPKIDKKPMKTYSLSAPRDMKKPKPKFEDVLMSIDKLQYSKPKIKSKKIRDQIPKVVIKKSGLHYTSISSPSSESAHTPDLTGRKWQPWVFIEKNTFVDKMALKHKVKAIYCRRKKSYVLAEKFRKYKSVYNAKFVISQPKSDDLNKGNLKYTIRLKNH